MALIDNVKIICDRLAPLGWRDLVLAASHGELDISQKTADLLKKELVKDLTRIDRSVPGFADFASPGKNGISPGEPQNSLLFHAIASPLVRTNHLGEPLQGFPTLQDIETIENLVFGVQPPTIKELAERAGAKELSVVVFAYEYRNAAGTPANTNADLVFSRTGIARVGTAPALYIPENRGHWSEDDGDAHAIRVCPARYSAFLAVTKQGRDAAVLPIIWDEDQKNTDLDRHFWVPVHKLFDGRECISGLDLTIKYTSKHYNEKVRRVHMSLGEQPPDKPPYRFSEGIAEIANTGHAEGCLVVPVVHETLVEKAIFDNKPMTYVFPPQEDERFAAYEPQQPDSDAQVEINRYPAYAHARVKMDGGRMIDLNSQVDVGGLVDAGNYPAMHFLDFTGDGWVAVECAQLAETANLSPDFLPAYSVVAAPDFFPSCGQYELSKWSKSKEVPASLRDQIWGVGRGADPAPVALCEIRYPANLQLPDSPFSADDDTISAVVQMSGSTSPAKFEPSANVFRNSSLPDDAAGLFSPGWDVTLDFKQKNGDRQVHFVTYGLGSPFPEDTKLCAALSTFWPAVAPDVWRSMSPHTGNENLRGTIAPLTDEEIGQVGDLPWDGVIGPAIVEVAGKTFLEMASFLHVDYVQQALNNRFSVRLTARITAEEYTRRILAMLLVHKQIAGAGSPRIERRKWIVVSFLRVTNGLPELQTAQAQAKTVLKGAVYRVDMIKIGTGDPSIDVKDDPRRRLVPVNDRRYFFVDPENLKVLHRNDGVSVWAKWQLSDAQG